LQASLTERVGRIAALEAQLDDLRAAQVAWQVEKDASIQGQEQLTGRITELEDLLKHKEADILEV